MRTYTKEELAEIIRKHSLWIEGEDGGERANLISANLRSADLSSANLSYANLISADLSSANLSYANLHYADLISANLRSADLISANLSYANLSYANLISADLSYANLSSADLSYAASGNNRQVKTLQLGKYYTCISRNNISVGCQSHSPEEWEKFTDRDILEMDGKEGLTWWNTWKDVIFKVHETTK